LERDSFDDGSDRTWSDYGEANHDFPKWSD
jgi:hypothetical protein